MKIGAQLYTMRDFLQTERDMEYTLQKVSEMGYKIVQVSGVGPIDPKAIRRICDKNELQIVLTHTSQDRLLNDIDNVIEENTILGCDYVGIGSMPAKYMDPYFIHRFAEDYKETARKIKKAGKLFMYHNHDFEWQKVNGKYAIETLMEAFEPDEMGFTLDTYWVQAAGVDLYEWLKILKDRIPCVHLKDMELINRERLMAPVGQGNIDFVRVMKQLEEQGTTKFALVEQDRCQCSPFEAMKISCDYLATLGY